MTARLKKGDTVLVLSGKDKGKKGKILSISTDGATVEKVNVSKRHMRPSKNSPGGIIEKLMKINLSKLLPVCAKCNEGTRVKFEMVDNEKVRKCVNCSEVLDKVK
jgi:large subunit ribosomal protein L24